MPFSLEQGELTLVNHRLYTALLHKTAISVHGGVTTVASYALKQELFALKNPYIADPSQALQQTEKPSQVVGTRRKKKKSKRKFPYDSGELEVVDKLWSVSEKLQNIVTGVGQSIIKNFFAVKQEPSHVPEISKEDLDGANDLSLFRYFQSDSPPPAIVENRRSLTVVVLYERSSLLIPPFARFLKSDVSRLRLLTDDCSVRGKYNCVLLDPPWENKSVKRGRKYDYLSFNQIRQLPVASLAQDGCLIAVWVTNKKRILDFVIDELFPWWHVKYFGKWFWVKVTCDGVPIYPFSSLHKKPFEALVLGRFVSSPSACYDVGIASEKVFCSVPCRVHSHKPPVYDMLEQLSTSLGAAHPRCLEMFARNLVPRWTSWGNEVWMMQDMDYYEKLKS